MERRRGWGWVARDRSSRTTLTLGWLWVELGSHLRFLEEGSVPASLYCVLSSATPEGRSEQRSAPAFPPRVQLLLTGQELDLGLWVATVRGCQLHVPCPQCAAHPMQHAPYCRLTGPFPGKPRPGTTSTPCTHLSGGGARAAARQMGGWEAGSDVLMKHKIFRKSFALQ